MIDTIVSALNLYNSYEGAVLNEALTPLQTVVGFSSFSTRALLNNLGALISPLNYLEVGLYMGSTFLSVLYNNTTHLGKAYGIDNWSEFNYDGLAKESFFRNYKTLIGEQDNISIFDGDCFSFDLGNVTVPINLFMYDGGHKKEQQTQAFTYFSSVLSNTFMTIVDDWNWEHVRSGTFDAFNSLGFEVQYKKELFTEHNGATDSWWNGLLIAVINKGN
jgi:hypothetical protein